MGKKKHNFSSNQPKKVTKKLLSSLKDRARNIIIRRYGLEDGSRRTLESIGQEYGITRERVRQIENFALKAIRKSETLAEAREIFDELINSIHDLGGMVSEEEILKQMAEDSVHQNHVHFYLVVGDDFTAHKDDLRFSKRWSVDRKVSEYVHDIIHDIYHGLEKDELLKEEDVLKRVLAHENIKNLRDRHVGEKSARTWLNFTKLIGVNPVGEWGDAKSPNVKTRGVRDYAYLVLRRQGCPMHFREVAQSIADTFGKKAHVATTHNELIKDARFVLVGRGVYALREWGYKEGVVRDVIADILRQEGPLDKEDVVQKVMKERYLKRNTILVNLQNPDYFVRNTEGLYRLKEEFVAPKKK
jgi:DNA-directed RNA polymerase delta subunit